MSNKMYSLILTVAIFIIAVVGVILTVNAMSTPEIDPETGLKLTNSPGVSSSVDFAWYLFIGCGILIAGFTIFAIATNPKRFIPTAIGIGVFGALVAIAYTMVTVEKTGTIVTLEEATKKSLMWSGLGIQTTLVLVIVALGLILLGLGRNIMTYFQK